MLTLAEVGLYEYAKFFRNECRISNRSLAWLRAHPDFFILLEGLPDQIIGLKKSVEVILHADDLVICKSNRFQVRQALAPLYVAFTDLRLILNLKNDEI